MFDYMFKNHVTCTEHKETLFEPFLLKSLKILLLSNILYINIFPIIYYRYYINLIIYCFICN